LKLAQKIILGLLQRENNNFPIEIVQKYLDNKEFLKAIIITSVEIVLFIANVEEISFYKLTNRLKLDIYDFWKIINPFIHFDILIPYPIRNHFEEIEVQILSFIIWNKHSNKFKKELEESLDQSPLQISMSDSISKRDVDDVENTEFNNQSLFVYL
jgi:hypothetical protein